MTLSVAFGGVDTVVGVTTQQNKSHVQEAKQKRGQMGPTIPFERCPQ